MSENSYPTGSAPEIRIESIGGNLQVKGWDTPEVRVDSDPESLQAQESEDELQFSCSGNCSLRVPYDAILRVQRVHGNARFKSLEDRLAIEEIRGNLELNQVADASVGAVRGDLSARSIAGDLQVDQVGGNATLRDIDGSLTLDQVSGNLDLRNLEIDLHAVVKGNARLRLGLVSGSTYMLEASGNVYCRFDEAADLAIEITSGAENIKIDLPGHKETVRSREHTLTLGSGTAEMRLEAGGMAFVSGRSSPGLDLEDALGDDYSEFPEDFGERLSRQIESQLEAQIEIINRQIESQIEGVVESLEQSGLSEAERERILARARLSGERAASRAQEKARRAQQRLERKMENMRRRSEQAQRKQDLRADAAVYGVSGQTESRQEPTEEERLMILRMLEQKKISLQEAEELLEALEGRSS